MINWRKPIVYLLFYLAGSEVPADLKYLHNLDKKPYKDQKAEQERKLKALLRHAYKNVPYYRKVLQKCGVIDHAGSVHLENFNKILFLTKDVIRKEKSNLYSIDHKKRKSFENTSGGSTGEPTVFLQDKVYKDMNYLAVKIFFQQRFGRDIGEPEVDVWGSERDVFKNSLSLKERVINFLYNRTILNAFKFDEKKLGDFVRIINERKPISMWVFVESIEELCKYIQRNNLEVHSPKFIMSTAGTLYPEIRKLVSDTFKCPVYNQYGSREMGSAAVECEKQDGLHGLPGIHYLEIVDGEIVVTTLSNYSMPLIRYKVGDTAVAPKSQMCECGKGFKIFQEVTGRTVSHFKTRDGKTIHAMILIRQFWFRPWLKKFQIVQEDYDKVVCHLTLQGEPDLAQVKEIKERINFIMGGNCEVEFNYVDNIEPSPSGKFLYTISKIQN